MATTGAPVDISTSRIDNIDMNKGPRQVSVNIAFSLYKCCVCGKEYDASHFGFRKRMSVMYKSCVKCREKRRALCKNNQCEHGHIRWACSKCTDRRCEHGAFKSSCVKCKPQLICPHNTCVYTCRKCHRCVHGKYQRTCYECAIESYVKSSNLTNQTSV